MSYMWTNEEKDLVAALTSQGIPRQVIAERVGRTAHAVRYLQHLEGIGKEDPPEHFTAEHKRLHATTQIFLGRLRRHHSVQDVTANTYTGSR